MNQTIKETINAILAHEGGYQNSKNDAGNFNSKGERVGTNYGISAKVYEEYLGRSVSEEDMKALTEKEAVEIYEKQYINPVTNNLGIDPESPIFTQVVDMVVNHGYGNTVPIVQRAVGTKVDGKSGKGTRKAIADMLSKDPSELNNALAEERKEFYKAVVRSNPDNKEFLEGWLRRAESFKR